MTDKQIIIDGCDVSGCRHYNDRYGYCDACRDDIDGASFTKCLYEDNCYYKQLKRAEAQCEAMFVSHTDLEKKYKAKEQECETLASQLDFEVQKKECLEQECEELKEEIKKHNDDMFKNPPEKRFYCKGCTLPYISKKLKQTLTEIKEIATCPKKIETTFNINNWTEIRNNILQKISECEGNDEKH